MSGADRFANPTSYHRVYRAPKPWLNFSTISAAAVALGSAVGLWFAATAPMQGTTERSIWVSLCLVFLGLGAFVVLSIVLQRVVLHPDRIEVHALGTTRSLRREEIRGWRSTGTSPVVIILEPKDRDRKAVGFTLWFPLDEELQGWLDAVPCLNKDVFRESKAEIRNDPRLGRTPGERMRSLGKLKTYSRILTVGTCIVGVWGVFYPGPSNLDIVTLSLLPWIALVVVKRSGGLFRLDTISGAAHPSVALVIVIPALVLMLRAIGAPVVYSWLVAWEALGVAAVFTLAGVAADKTLRKSVKSAIGVAGAMTLYGYAVTVQANVLLDSAPSESHTATVEKKVVGTGRGQTHKLYLSAWGPKAGSNSLTVGRETFEAIRPGDLVHINLMPGALGVKWYYMRSWERGPQ